MSDRTEYTQRRVAYSAEVESTKNGCEFKKITVIRSRSSNGDANYILLAIDTPDGRIRLRFDNPDYYAEHARIVSELLEQAYEDTCDL